MSENQSEYRPIEVSAIDREFAQTMEAYRQAVLRGNESVSLWMQHEMGRLSMAKCQVMQQRPRG